MAMAFDDLNQLYPFLGLLNVKQYGAYGDGLHDDTVAINNAINAVHSAGGGTLIFPPGTYVVSDTCGSPQNIEGNITIWGYGATIVSTLNSYIWPQYTNTGILTLLGDNVRIFGLTLRYQADIQYDQMQGSNITTYDPTQPGYVRILYMAVIVVGGMSGVYSPQTPVFAQNIIIRDCHIENSWCSGIMVAYSSHVWIESCFIKNCLGTSIYTYGFGTTDLNIVNNNITRSRDDCIFVSAFASYNGQLTNPPSRRIRIIGNQCSNTFAKGIGLSSQWEGEISGNQIENTWASGIDYEGFEQGSLLAGVQRLRISGNTIVNAGQLFAPAWVPGQAYTVGQYVISVTLAYVCISNVTSVAAPAGDTSHWTATGGFNYPAACMSNSLAALAINFPASGNSVYTTDNIISNPYLGGIRGLTANSYWLTGGLKGTGYLAGSVVIYSNAGVWTWYTAKNDVGAGGSAPTVDTTNWTVLSIVPVSQGFRMTGNSIRDVTNGIPIQIGGDLSPFNPGAAISLANLPCAEDVRISDNEIVNCPGHAMYVSHLADVSVEGNTIRNYGTAIAPAWVTGTVYYLDDMVSYNGENWWCTNTTLTGFTSTVAPHSGAPGDEGALNWLQSNYDAVIFVTCARARTGGNRVYDLVGTNNYGGAVSSNTDASGVTCGDVLWGDDMFQSGINAFTESGAGNTQSRAIMFIGNHRVTWGTTAPADGTWAQGDVCINTGVGASASPGFICSVGGSPGTWLTVKTTWHT